MQIDSEKTNVNRRLAMLCAFGFFQGTCIGPLIELAVYLDPAILYTAIIGTITVFACFSLSALLAKRRSYLFLGGMLGSALSLMFYMSLANIFFRSSTVNLFQVYGGLIVFSGYVIFDTQLIIEVQQQYFIWIT